MKLLGDAVQAGPWTKRVRKLIAFASGKERVAHSPASFRSKSTGAKCAELCVLALCLGLNAFAADSTPPTINSFSVSQSVPQDFPIHVQFAYSRYYGPCYDPSTGITVTQALQVTWPTRSNYMYTAWFGPTVIGPWTEWATPASVHPARLNATFQIFVPVYPNGKRYYQIRANPSIGITYPP